MERFTVNKLNLHPRSDEALHAALTNFELKWQQKALHRVTNERVYRF